MIRLLVLYPRTEGTKFDTDYWLTTHMDLVRTNLTPLGLVKAEADAADDGPFYGAAHLFFDSMADLGAAMGAPEGAAVAADMANYTDTQATMALLEVKQ